MVVLASEIVLCQIIIIIIIIIILIIILTMIIIIIIIIMIIMIIIIIIIIIIMESIPVSLDQAAPVFDIYLFSYSAFAVVNYLCI